jgi:hypothetical protein
MENINEDYKNIPGWGIDADSENEPTYPMKHYTGDDHERLNYTRPALQPETVEILHSNERPNLTAVFGTSVPPSGVSGAIRRFAFKYSEASWNHWLPLLFADRVNMVEGIVDDLAHGHIPNIWAEKGYNAEWKHNKKGLLIKIASTATVLFALSVLVSKKRRRKS